MKIVFLDIDGVVNHRGYLGRGERKDPPTEAEAEIAPRIRDAVSWECYRLDSVMLDLRSIDPTRVVLVQQLIAMTGAKVVISSSWRHGQTVEGMRLLLAHHGLDAESVIGMTPTTVLLPDGKIAERGHEIQAWLDAHPDVESFVILDDDRDMAHLSDRHVKTDNHVGITPDNVQAAGVILDCPLR